MAPSARAWTAPWTLTTLSTGTCAKASTKAGSCSTSCTVPEASCRGTKASCRDILRGARTQPARTTRSLTSFDPTWLHACVRGTVGQEATGRDDVLRHGVNERCLWQAGVPDTQRWSTQATVHWLVLLSVTRGWHRSHAVDLRHMDEQDAQIHMLMQFFDFA